MASGTAWKVFGLDTCLRRDAGAAPAATRAGSQVAVRVHQRAQLALHHSGLCPVLERAGEAAGLGLKVHPHMLRHACGFALANKGHDTRALQAYLGPQHPAHGALHGAVAGSVQGLLAVIMAKARAASLPAVRLAMNSGIVFAAPGVVIKRRHTSSSRNAAERSHSLDLPEGLNSGQPIPRHY